MQKKPAFFIFLIVITEIAVFLWSNHLAGSDETSYQLAARYSARISFFLVVATLGWMGVSGLNAIYQEEKSRMFFVQLLMLFSINHFIHLFFLSMNFWINNMNIFEVRNLFGALIYVSLIIVPVYLWNKKELKPQLYLTIYSFLFGVTAVFFLTYLGRLSKELPFPSSKVFFYTSLFAIGGLMLLNVYRILSEKRTRDRT